MQAATSGLVLVHSSTAGEFRLSFFNERTDRLAMVLCSGALDQSGGFTG